MNKKVYILQKDLPDAKKGDVYILRRDMYRPLTAELSSSPVIETNSYFQWQVENNPEWFLPKEEKIEVTRLERDMGNRYNLILSGQIPDEKYEAVKKSIEFVLNT
jgi:hypothetical protein